MRPRSMTGFGRGEAQAGDRIWTVEIRTVNHRFLDQRVAMPRTYQPLEDQVKKRVATSLDRGRVEVNCSLQGQEGTGARLVLDRNLAQQYLACLTELATMCGPGEKIGLGHLLCQRDLIVQEEVSPDLAAEWQVVGSALDKALAECDRMREQEGQKLKEELLSRLAGFSGLVDSIEIRLPELLRQRQDDLQRRLDKLLAGVDLDPMRLHQEMAIMTDKSDVTEEMVRLRSHIHQFQSFLDDQQPVGRKLDFLLQEFLREVNTLASKINNASIAHVGVELKNEIEKLREQVQNLE
jgi:uncharacterized protein (TIGR00255 family)